MDEMSRQAMPEMAYEDINYRMGKEDSLMARLDTLLEWAAQNPNAPRHGDSQGDAAYRRVSPGGCVCVWIRPG